MTTGSSNNSWRDRLQDNWFDPDSSNGSSQQFDSGSSAAGSSVDVNPRPQDLSIGSGGRPAPGLSTQETGQGFSEVDFDPIAPELMTNAGPTSSTPNEQVSAVS